MDAPSAFKYTGIQRQESVKIQTVGGAAATRRSFQPWRPDLCLYSRTGACAIAFRSPGFGKVVKGNNRTLVIDGEIQWDEMKSAHISEDDLREAIRRSGHPSDVRKVKSAHLERDGALALSMRLDQLVLSETRSRLLNAFAW